MTSRLRPLLRRAHLWLGLFVGLLFALLGLTGSALIFYQEIDALLHPEIAVASTQPAAGWSSPVWDSALATVRTRWPESGGQWRFEATGQQGPISARYYPSGAPNGHMAKRIMVWLSPDGRRILRHEGWGEYAMSWIYELHMDLLSEERGHKVVGWSGVAILLLLGTGLTAWWPRGSWQKAMAFKRNASRIRRLHDLHKLAGLWSMLLLAVFALTGFMLALPRESNWLMAQAGAPVDATPSPRSHVQNRPQISLDMALAIGHRTMFDGRLAWIEVPPPGPGVIKLRVQVPGDPSRRFPHSYIYIDQYSGVIIDILDARRAGPATTVNNWLHPLHDASVGGLSTRILACLVGFMPAGLFITGLLRWRERRVRRAVQTNKIQGKY